MKQIVSFHADSVYSIPKNFFLEFGLKTLIVDLDNTLDAYDTLIPRKEAFQLKESLSILGIELIIISNNHEKRVKPYAEQLGCRYLADANKFSKKKIVAFLNRENIAIDKTLFVGDQLFTDRIYVNKIKGNLILTEPLEKKDHFFTRWIRWLDILLRKYYLKQNRLGIKID